MSILRPPSPAVREALRRSDVDALLLWKDENVRYLTSLRAQLIAGKMSSLNGVLMARDADPVLLCSGGEINKGLDGDVVARGRRSDPDHGAA